MAIPFVRSASIFSDSDLKVFSARTHAAIEDHLAAFPASARESLHKQLDEQLSAAKYASGDTFDVAIEVFSADKSLASFDPETLLKEFDTLVLSRFNKLSDLSKAHPEFFTGLDERISQLSQLARDVVKQYGSVRQDAESTFKTSFGKFHIPERYYIKKDLKTTEKVKGDVEKSLNVTGPKIISNINDLVSEYVNMSQIILAAIDLSQSGQHKLGLPKLKRYLGAVQDMLARSKELANRAAYWESTNPDPKALPENYDMAIRALIALPDELGSLEQNIAEEIDKVKLVSPNAHEDVDGIYQDTSEGSTSDVPEDDDTVPDLAAKQDVLETPEFTGMQEVTIDPETGRDVVEQDDIDEDKKSKKRNKK